jgi:hypothetical protein
MTASSPTVISNAAGVTRPHRVRFVRPRFGQTRAPPKSAAQREENDVGVLKNWKAVGAAVALASIAIDANATFAQTDWESVSGLIASSGPYVMQSELPPATTASEFGTAVAMWHDATTGVDWAVVGAPTENALNGAAYVFSLAPGNTIWHQEARLVASDSTDGSEFGYSVAIDQGTVVVGAPLHVADFFVGAAYVFVRDDVSGAWTQQGDPLADGDSDYGFAVAVSGDSLAVSEPAVSKVFAYTRTGDVWSSPVTLTSPDVAADADFGVSLSMHEDTLLVGAPLDGKSALQQGSAALFTRSVTGWDLQQTLRPEIDTSAQQFFGYSVAFSNDAIVVGAPAQHAGVGAAHMFTYDAAAGKWSEQSVFGGPTGAVTPLFGESVAISGDRLIVAAPGKDTADIFELRSGAWVLESSLSGDAATFFGQSVGAAGDKFIVGVPGPGLSSDGDVYVFMNDRIFANGIE